MKKQTNAFHNQKLFADKGTRVSSDKINSMIANFVVWFKEDWKLSEEKLLAKRRFLLGLLFLNIMKNSATNTSLIVTTSKLRK